MIEIYNRRIASKIYDIFKVKPDNTLTFKAVLYQNDEGCFVELNNKPIRILTFYILFNQQNIELVVAPINSLRNVHKFAMPCGTAQHEEFSVI